MKLTMLKSKIHRASVTESNLHYEGSITIDSDLLKQAKILPYEQVDVLNITNGERFTTYTIEAPAGSREFCINGAAARKAEPGDLIIICAFSTMEQQQAESHKPTILLLDEHNKVKENGRIAA